MYYKENLILRVDTTEKLFSCGWILQGNSHPAGGYYRETLFLRVDTTGKLFSCGRIQGSSYPACGYYRETLFLRVLEENCYPRETLFCK
jgi:hypothetical protein